MSGHRAPKNLPGRPLASRRGPKTSDGRQLWTCDGCGCVETWGPSWAWYGSLLGWDEGLAEWVACSEACMAKRSHAAEVEPAEHKHPPPFEVLR